MKSKLLIAVICAAILFPLILTGCADKTPEAISSRFENLAEGGKFVKSEGKAGESAVFELGGQKTFNTLVLKEKGDSITKFRLYADGAAEPFYGNDFVDGYRYCSFGEVTASEIRIEVQAAEGEWKLAAVEAYLAAGVPDGFEVMSYIHADAAYSLTAEQAVIARNVTDFNLFGAIYLNKDGGLELTEYEINGEVLSGEEVLREAVKVLKGVRPDATVVATVLGNKDFGDGLAVNERHGSAMGENGDKLIANINALIQKTGLDGISFDYEYPRTIKDFNIYAKFAEKLKSAMPAGKRLTAALALWNISLTFMQAKELEPFDRIEMMAYDMFDKRGNHSTFYDSAYEIVKQLDKKGVDLKKVNLGLPFYSRPVNADSYWGNYYDVADKLGRYDNTYVEAYTDLDGKEHPELANYYNGRQMIYDKTSYAIDCGLGGVMIWHFGTDSFDPDLSLINEINAAITARGAKG